MTLSYDTGLVVLSCAIVVVAAFTALELARRANRAQGSGAARLWLAAGACALGTGMWAMQFVGVLANHASMPGRYSAGTALLSLTIAILLSGIALGVGARTPPRLPRIVAAGLLLGAAVVAMHYIDMAAMGARHAMRYGPVWLAVSAVVAIAVLAGVTALWVSHQLLGLQDEGRVAALRRLAAVIMGLAIAGMHYAGMAAMTVEMPHMIAGTTPAALPGNNHLWLAMAIGIVTLIVLGFTLLQLIADGRLAAQVDRGDRLRSMLDDTALTLESERVRVRVMLDAIADGVITTDRHGHITHLNPTAEGLTGWPADAAICQRFVDVCQLVDEESEAPLDLSAVLDAGRLVYRSSHTLLRTRDGTQRPVDYKASPVKDADGRVVGAVVVMGDVSSRHEMLRKLNYQAQHDALTGLLNRHAFDERLQALVRSMDGDSPSSVLAYIDLDHFKVINDGCGHAAGDTVLEQISALLREGFRGDDYVARLGGDEFAVILQHCEPVQAHRRMEVVRERIAQYRYTSDGHAYSVGASIGMARIDPGDTPSRILSAADIACYEAKREGRNLIRMFEGGDARWREHHAEVKWLPLIEQALETDRFVLYAQRILDIKSGAGDSFYYEILLRYVDDEGRHIPPMTFIPTAERYLLMPEIDRWVVRNAFALMHGQREALSGNHKFAINLSGQSLTDESFLGFVEAQIEQWSITPTMLCFEITETVAITNFDHARHFIRRLRHLGCDFALDDFGSGMSSFAYLKDLPISHLKIDGCFIRDLLDDAVDDVIVSSICAVGRTLGLGLIAEFVENEALIDKLRTIGVDYAQGFGIDRPQQIDALFRHPPVQLADVASTGKTRA